MRFIYFLLFTVALTFSACQPDSKPGKKLKKATMFADFYVRYLQPERELKAEAFFMEGKEYDKAKPSRMSDVIFQGKLMNERHIPQRGTRYRTERVLPYELPIEFHYGEDGHFELYMSPIEEFIVKGDISKSAGMTLVLKGEKLQQNESIVLLFSGAESKATSVTIPGPTEGIEIPVTSDQLKDLQIGPAQFYLVKKQDFKLEKPGHSIQGLTEYYTKSIDVEVIE